PKRSVAWLLTRERLQTFALPPAATINAAARAAIDDCKDPVAKKHAAVDALSRLLAIDRIANAIHQRHLVIIAHGILNDVPFEALTVSEGRPLIERAAISYAPSASSLA